MNTQILEEIGLERNEIKVYLTLSDLGLTTTGVLVKKSGVPSSHIYQVLQHLIEKGLVSYTTIKNTKHFKAQDPKRLYEFIDSQKKLLLEKENELSQIIPELKQKQLLAEKLEKKEQKVQTFEGIKGIKTALENVLNILKKGDEFIVFGSPRIGSEKLHGFFNDFHKRRAKKGIKYKIIYNSDAKEFGEERKKYELTEVRFLPRGMNTPSVSWIFKDYVALVVFSEEPVALVIKNKQMVESFNSYFKFMWALCKP